MCHLKFKIDNLKDYQGHDLIFLTGSPGSKWSNAHRICCEHPDINMSDWSEDKSWNMISEDPFGEVHNTGGHRGSYWGPGNLYGKNFGRLDMLTKEEFLKEFMDAYENWDNYKIIKSHWFAYNLEYIMNIFPKASLILTYSGDIESFYWWHKQGGWGLGYADYSWYKDDYKMLKQIKEENSIILKFAIDRDLDLDFCTRTELWKKLGLRTDVKPIVQSVAEANHDVRVTCKLAIYNSKYISNFNFLSPSDTSHIRKQRNLNEI